MQFSENSKITDSNKNSLEKNDARRFWTSKTAGLVPYIPGEQPRGKKFIKLNTNENPYSPPEEVIKSVQEFSFDSLRLYPDPTTLDLRKSIADYFGVSTENVFAGNGSDEVLAFAFKAFFDKNEHQVVFPDITYSFYPVYADFFELNWQTIPLNENYEINIADYCQQEKAVVLANPNAPTGVALSLYDIECIVKADQNRLVIIDEAYVDFGAESAVQLLSEYDNLLVIQTMSKSRSLAGMRIGYAIGDAALIEGLQRVRDSINSYTLDTIAQKAGIAAINSSDWFEITISKIIKTRENVKRALEKIGFEVLPSKSNFLFARHSVIEAQYIYDKLREAGILVRYFNKERINQFLRISIGTDEDMNIFIEKIAEIIE